MSHKAPLFSQHVAEYFRIIGEGLAEAGRLFASELYLQFSKFEEQGWPVRQFQDHHRNKTDEEV